MSTQDFDRPMPLLFLWEARDYQEAHKAQHGAYTDSFDLFVSPHSRAFEVTPEGSATLAVERIRLDHVEIGVKGDPGQGCKIECHACTLAHTHILLGEIGLLSFAESRVIASRFKLGNGELALQHTRLEDSMVGNGSFSDLLTVGEGSVLQNCSVKNIDVLVQGSYATNLDFTGSGAFLAATIVDSTVTVQSNKSLSASRSVFVDSSVSSLSLWECVVAATPGALSSISDTLFWGYPGDEAVASAFIGVGTGRGVKAKGTTVANSLIFDFETGIAVGSSTQDSVIQGCNLLSGAGYSLENLLEEDFTAQGNWWGSLSETVIGESIWDYWDDTQYGKVDFSGYLTEPNPEAPIAPPQQVTKLAVPGGLEIMWLPNLESDLTGYRVHWGKPTGYSFAESLDVGSTTSVVLEDVSVSETIAVTAYDIEATGVNDQVRGHESWFAEAAPAP